VLLGEEGHTWEQPWPDASATERRLPADNLSSVRGPMTTPEAM
jgi:hypothetical protein